jgi:4-hydroxy-tetrahydrodipicolinate reductase
MINIAILGAAGRMGQMIARHILAHHATEARIAFGVEHKNSWANGKDIGSILGLPSFGVAITTDREAAFKSADVLIDFTTPEATMEHAALSHQYGKPVVFGTTGLGQIELAAIKTASTKAPVVQSFNMSVGVNVLLALIEKTAQQLDASYDIEIIEAHHKHKVDAPSGTAIAMAQAAARGRKIDLEKAMIPARYGHVGPRPDGSIGFSVVRGGDIIGEHTVMFAGTGEQVEITHKASDRSLFAKGAAKAALWLPKQPRGLYTMRDVMGL